MMKRMWITLLLLAVLTGCLPQAQTPPVQDQEVIGTLVAATLTAETIHTDQPETTEELETPSPGETIATPTPTETPTPTQTLTPTNTNTPEPVPGDPALSLGVPTFLDNFQDGSNFYLYDEPQSSYQVDDNRMILTAKKANGYDTWSLSWGELKNFYLEITGTFGEECGGKDRYGMIFRAPDTSQGYWVSISCDGSYRLSAWDSEEKENIIIKKWTSSEYINSGPGGTNRLGIKAKGTKLMVYINGHQVCEKNDTTFNKGRFGIMVAATNTPGFQAYLTQARYWELP